MEKDVIKAKLTIKGRLKGLNTINKTNRANKYAGNTLKKEQQQKVCQEILIQSIPHFERLKIVFNWYEGNTKRDYDNICSAKKVILDALVKMGKVDNDSQKYIYPQFIDNFYYDKEDPRIEVELVEW